MTENPPTGSSRLRGGSTSPSQTFDLSLEGAPLPGTRLQFYGMFQGCEGIPSVCARFGLALAERFDGVALHSYNGGDFFLPQLRRLAGVDPRASVGIFYGFPDEMNDRFAQHPIRIGGFVCETDRISPRWVEACNTLHLVLVPSTWCRDAFVASGVRVPILVVPHGLEPEFRPTGEKRRAEPLVFFDTFHASSHLDRKGAEELVRCFLAAFGPSGEKAILRLRTEISGQLVDIRLRHDFGEAIRIDPGLGLSTADYARVYSEVHCTVHPARGEGFGLVPFQSIACETPVIAAPVTGMADYLDDDNALLLKTRGRARGRDAGHSTGHYFQIDEEHLVELLLRMHADWENEYEKVKLAGPDHRRRYRWQTVLEDFLQVVEAALARPEPEAFSTFLAEHPALGPASHPSAK